MRLADLVAYINHDIDDALRAGVIAGADLPAGMAGSAAGTATGSAPWSRDIIGETMRAGSARRDEPGARGGLRRVPGVPLRPGLLRPRTHAEFLKAAKILRDLYEHYLAARGDGPGTRGSRPPRALRARRRLPGRDDRPLRGADLRAALPAAALAGPVTVPAGRPVGLTPRGKAFTKLRKCGRAGRRSRGGGAAVGFRVGRGASARRPWGAGVGRRRAGRREGRRWWGAGRGRLSTRAPGWGVGTPRRGRSRGVFAARGGRRWRCWWSESWGWWKGGGAVLAALVAPFLVVFRGVAPQPAGAGGYPAALAGGGGAAGGRGGAGEAWHRKSCWPTTA